MKPLVVFISLVLFLGACNNVTQPKQEAPNVDDTTSIDHVYNNIKEHKKLPQKVLLAYDVGHNFSSKQQKDHFKLTIYGDSIYTGIILFQIISYDNRQIYADTFAARELMGDLYDTAFTLKQKEDTIKWRASLFFAENNFRNPAIKDTNNIGELNENADEDVLQNAVSYKDEIGFTFSYGYEGVYSIAYSKKKRKAVFYFVSD